MWLRTCEIQDAYGKPLSRAKAKSCLDEPAMIVMQLQAPRMMMRATMAFVAARDPVVL